MFLPEVLGTDWKTTVDEAMEFRPLLGDTNIEVKTRKRGANNTLGYIMQYLFLFLSQRMVFF